MRFSAAQMTRFAELYAMNRMAELARERDVSFTAGHYAAYAGAFRNMDEIDLEILVLLHDWFEVTGVYDHDQFGDNEHAKFWQLQRMRFLRRQEDRHLGV